MWDWIVKGFNALAQAPLGFWTIVLALLVSVVGTQWIKFMVPFDWSTPCRARVVQLIALSLAMLTTAILWPSATSAYGIFTGFVIGMLSTTIYAVSVRWVGRSEKWGWVRECLSQDTRK